MSEERIARPGERFALFLVACLVVCFCWDVFLVRVSGIEPFSFVADVLGTAPLLLVPPILCFALGRAASLWRPGIPRVLQGLSAAWCLVAPFLALYPAVIAHCAGAPRGCL